MEKGLLFTYALTYGGAVASLFNPFVGLLIYICFATIKPESLWFWSVPQGNYSRIVAIALLAGWALRGFGNWDFGRAKPVVYALLAFWGWSAVSSLYAPNPSLAWSFFEAKSKIFLPVLVGITLVDSVDRLKQLAWVLVLSQGYVAYDLNLAYYDGFNRLHLYGFAGMDNNSFAIGMVAVGGLAFFLGLAEKIWWRRLVCFAAAAFMVHSCMFAMSRGAMLGLCVMAAVSFYFVANQPRHWWALIVGLLLAFRLAGPDVTQRFVSAFADPEERDASAQSRLDMWESCIEVMLENPLVGCGPDHWPLLASRFGWAQGKEAHTLWLQTGAEMGIPGLASLAAFYGLCCLSLWRFWQIRSRYPEWDPWVVDVAPMVIASLTGFAVAAQFVSLEGLEPPYYVALLGAGALKLVSQQTAEWEAGEPAAEDSELEDAPVVDFQPARA